MCVEAVVVADVREGHDLEPLEAVPVSDVHGEQHGEEQGRGEHGARARDAEVAQVEVAVQPRVLHDERARLRQEVRQPAQVARGDGGDARVLGERRDVV